MIERSDFNDDTTALNYARARGYCSYSSIKMIRDCESPGYSEEIWFEFGKELHSRLLENKKIKTLSADEEEMLAVMLKKLRAHPVAKQLLAKSRNEQQFDVFIYGVRVLGYIDILNVDSVADLKTTKCNTMKAFVAQMDFLQAALYLKATGRKDFYYLGISKLPPYDVFPFSVKQYPVRLALAQFSMRRLLMYIKSKWGCDHRDKSKRSTLVKIAKGGEREVCTTCGGEFKIVKRA